MTDQAKAQPIDADEVPVSEIARLRNGADPEGVGAELARVATEVGFFYVRNHGVDDAVVERARSTAFEFFRMPEEAKRAAGTNRFHHGYLKPGSTKMYDDARLDLKESFNWGIELDGISGVAPDPGTAPANPLLGPNVWPAAMPELKAGIYPYFEAASGCERLSLVLAYDPNFETLVDPRALCADGETPRYEPIICGDYLLWRFGKAFSYRQ